MISLNVLGVVKKYNFLALKIMTLFTIGLHKIGLHKFIVASDTNSTGKKRFSLLLVTLLMCLPIGQAWAQAAFTSSWETTTRNEGITIPVRSGLNYNYNIDCGTGGIAGDTGRSNPTQMLSSRSVAVPCTYAKIGMHTISITGMFPSTYFNDAAESRGKLRTISNWGTAVGWNNMESAFEGATGLTSVPNNTTGLEGVTDMSSMFAGATAFNSDISDWNVSKVMNMTSMFAGATAFNSNISGWDVSALTQFGNMFNNASAFSQNLGPWYITTTSENPAIINEAGATRTIVAQSTPTPLQTPDYAVTAQSSGTFSMTGTTLTLDAPDLDPTTTEYRVTISATGSSLYGTSNSAVITFRVIPATDLQLSTLTASPGRFATPFDGGTATHTIYVASDQSTVTLTPTVRNPAVATSINRIRPADTIPPIPPIGSGSPHVVQLGIDVSGLGDTTSVTLVVSASGGAPSMTYTINIVRPFPSTDATLSNLVPSPGTLNTLFTSGQRNYAVNIDRAISTLTVTPTATDSNAVIMISNADSTMTDVPIDSGTASDAFTLFNSANTITVTVTAEDKETIKKYILTIPRAFTPTDATLQSLVLSGDALLVPAFGSAIVEYDSEVDFGVETITVTPTVTADSPAGATVIVSTTADGLVVEGNVITLEEGVTKTITVTVTAIDRSTPKAYMITMLRNYSQTDANLSALTVSSGSLVRQDSSGAVGFSGAVTEYAVDVAYSDVASITVTPTVSTPGAVFTITAEGSETVTLESSETSATSASIPLTSGVTKPIMIKVTARNGETMKTYTINATSAFSPTDATLKNLVLSDGALTPEFAKETLNYDSQVDFEVSSIIVTPTVTAGTLVGANGEPIVGATVIVSTDDGPVEEGKAIDLVAGAPKTITVTVTAINGTPQPDPYTITMLRNYSQTDADLSALTLSAFTADGASAPTLDPTLDPAFSNTTTEYAVAVKSDVASITVTPTVSTPGAVFTITAEGSETVTLESSETTTSATSASIPLTSGVTKPIMIKVTARNGETMKTYTINAHRDIPVQVALTQLALSQGSLEPTFNPAPSASISYTARIGDTTKVVTITPTVFFRGATVTASVRGKGTSVTKNEDSFEFTLTREGTQTFATITVANTGATDQNYFIELIRGLNTHDRSRQLHALILPLAAQTANSATLSAIADRIGDLKFSSPIYRGNILSLNGQDDLSQIVKQLGSAAQDDALDLKRWLGNSEFSIGLNDNTSNRARKSKIGFWGNGSYDALREDDASTIQWDGQMAGTHLGFDNQINRHWLFGSALALSDGKFAYNATENSNATGLYEYQKTSIHPYMNWSPNSYFSLWSTFGYGTGEVKITDNDTGDKASGDLTQYSIALGTDVRLSHGYNYYGGKSQWHLKGDLSGLWADVASDSTSNSDIAAANLNSQRMRLFIEGQQGYRRASGASVTPSLIFGGRYDSGKRYDTENDNGTNAAGFGFEFGGGIRYQNPRNGFSLLTKAHILLAQDYDEWGSSLELRKQGTARSALSFSLIPSIGVPQSTQDDLWADNTIGITNGTPDLGAQLDGEVAYDMLLPSRWEQALHWQPYTGAVLASEQRRYRLGSRYLLGKDMSLSLEAGRQEAQDKVADHSIQIKGELKF